MTDAAARARWIQAAEAATPLLGRRSVAPRALVDVAADAAGFQGWSARDAGTVSELATRDLKRGDRLVVDFGEHLVGRLRLRLTHGGDAQDAPVRLRLVFAEVLAEVAEPLEPYTGSLSRAWLQDEVVTVDELPGEVALPRRYAFRWVAIEIVSNASFPVRIADLACDVETSAGEPLPPPKLDPELAAIDRVAVATLRNCMQTVFEDGPKRDRRLWIGDLRLQALANSVTFRRFDLVRRCLYLFAGLSRADGLVLGCVYERPRPSGGNALLEYALFFGPTLLDYALASGDWETARELYGVAAAQPAFALAHLDADGLFHDPGTWWIFIDWRAGLDKQGPMQGVLAYVLERMRLLAERLGKAEDAARWKAQRDRVIAAARRALRDGDLWVSGPSRQVSWATQAWMTLGGVATPAEGAAALRAVAARADALTPAGPYLWHHVVEAMLAGGMDQEAERVLRSYWGGMVRLGATTFWEVYDPADHRLSPYGSHHINSYCHAWSCTPTWFLRAFPGRFKQR